MAKILSSDTYTTPQPGRSVCVVKSFEVELKAADLVADNLINIGKPPEVGLGTSKVWRQLYATISRVGNSGIDNGTSNRFDLGDVNDVTRYAFSALPTSATVAMHGSGGYMGEPYPDEDVILKVRAAPAGAEDGTLRIIFYGFAA